MKNDSKDTSVSATPVPAPARRVNDHSAIHEATVGFFVILVFLGLAVFTIVVSGKSFFVTFTFHSKPLEIAALDRLEEPTYAVVKPVSR